MKHLFKIHTGAVNFEIGIHDNDKVFSGIDDIVGTEHTAPTACALTDNGFIDVLRAENIQARPKPISPRRS